MPVVIVVAIGLLVYLRRYAMSTTLFACVYGVGFYTWWLYRYLSRSRRITLTDEGTLSVHTPIRCREVRASDVTAINIASRLPALPHYRPVECLAFTGAFGKMEAYLNRDDIHAFLQELLALNPAITLDGLPPKEIPGALPKALRAGEVHRFRRNRTACIAGMVGAVAPLFFALTILVCWGILIYFERRFGAGVFPVPARFYPVLIGQLVALSLVSCSAWTMWSQVLSSVPVTLNAADVFRFKSPLRIHHVPARDILAIDVISRFGTWWADIVIQQDGQRARLGFPVLWLADYADFVAAVKALNPGVEIAQARQVSAGEARISG